MESHITLMKKIVFSCSVVLLFTSSAFATYGNPTESVLRNEHYQQLLRQTEGQYSKQAWDAMTPDQRSAAVERENARLKKIGSNKYNAHHSTSKVAE